MQFFAGHAPDGLIGEIITFSFTKEHKDYKVERIVD